MGYPFKILRKPSFLYICYQVGAKLVFIKNAFEEHNLLSLVVSNMAEGVSVVSVDDGAIVYANSKFEKIFGYGPNELTGKHVSILNASSDRSPEEIAESIIQTLNNTGTWEGEVYNIKKDGSEFWCYAKVSQFEHEIIGRVWVTVQQDITDRKQLQKQLEDRLAQLEDVLSKLRLLEGVLPICSCCKKIRDTSDNWHSLEKYISEHSEALFTHGFCPECYAKQLNEINDYKNSNSGRLK